MSTQLFIADGTSREIIGYIHDHGGAYIWDNSATYLTDGYIQVDNKKKTYGLDTDNLVVKDFTGGVSGSTALTGTLTFTNASDAVSATSGAFTTDLIPGDYIKLDADGTSVKVKSITDDDNLVLSANYSDTGGAGASTKVHDQQAVIDSVIGDYDMDPDNPVVPIFGKYRFESADWNAIELTP